MNDNKETESKPCTIPDVIERLKSLQKYDIEPIKDYSDCWLDIDPCNDEFAKWIKVEDVDKIIKELTNAL
jgi:hypothetical protein